MKETQQGNKLYLLCCTPKCTDITLTPHDGQPTGTENGWLQMERTLYLSPITETAGSLFLFSFPPCLDPSECQLYFAKDTMEPRVERFR